MLRLFQTIAGNERVDSGILSAETAIELGGIFAATLAEDVVTERAGSGRVKDSVFLEMSESVGIKNLNPLVAVVTCSITATESDKNNQDYYVEIFRPDIKLKVYFGDTLGMDIKSVDNMIAQYKAFGAAKTSFHQNGQPGARSQPMKLPILPNY